MPIPLTHLAQILRRRTAVSCDRNFQHIARCVQNAVESGLSLVRALRQCSAHAVPIARQGWKVQHGSRSCRKFAAQCLPFPEQRVSQRHPVFALLRRQPHPNQAAILRLRFHVSLGRGQMPFKMRRPTSSRASTWTGCQY